MNLIDSGEFVWICANFAILTGVCASMNLTRLKNKMEKPKIFS